MRPGDAWGYRPALDGVRALAVTLVVLFHAGMLEFGGGFVGVDLFFVLSGYLVTTILLTELGSTGTVRLRRFYARRIRRLLPAAIVLVVATSAAWVLIAPITERIELVGDARAALLYVANWSFIARSTDYFATDADRSPFIHFWSLSIEEQFYFLFPLLLIVLYRLRPRFGRHGRRVVPGALVAICAVSLLFQLAWAGSDPTRAYYGTEARFYQLAAGALLAVRLRRMPDRSRGGPGDRGLAWIGAIGLLVLGSGILGMSPSLRGMLATLLSVALIAGLERSPAGRVGFFFSRPPLVYLGRISYATYLWHWPIILFLGALLVVEPWVMALLALPLATALAALSAELVELPIRRAPLLDRFPRVVIAVGLATSVAVAVAIPVILEADRRPAIAGGEEDPWLFLPEESLLPSAAPPTATPSPTDAPPTAQPPTEPPIVPSPSESPSPAGAGPGGPRPAATVAPLGRAGGAGGPR
ncbi:MAG: acyltransferase family protein, partial [Chloroflexota bacterium]